MSTNLLQPSAVRQLSRREVVDKYPEVSPFVILKADVQRRSLRYTERALATLDRKKHQVNVRHQFAISSDHGEAVFPFSLLLRDGTSVISGPDARAEAPYVVDYLDGRTVIVDGGEIVDEVEFWPQHDFLDKFTSSGKPMWQIAGFSRPQRLDFAPYCYCHFWDNGHGCRYCNIGSLVKKAKETGSIDLRLAPQDVYETVREALKQTGRYVNILLSGGSIPGADHTFEEEVQVYIETLQAIGAAFDTRRFPSQLVASAFTEKQLERIYEQTGLLSYTTDLEVLDEEKFNWICPGKAETVGYREWRRRLIAAVDIFGRGRVSTAIVSGVNMAQPHGCSSEDEALEETLAGVEDLARHGISVATCAWNPCEGSAFHKQKTPSLEFHVRLARGIAEIARQYGLDADMDNYRRCGNHASTDLLRIA
jgi:hypothetical protein